MTRLAAQRKLHQHGQTGNWRFKGLLLAALDPDISPEDMAKAWPEPGKPSDYRFLSGRTDRTPEHEANRPFVGERGDDRYRLLKDHVAGGDNLPKYLSSGKVRELSEDGKTIGTELDGAVKRMLFSASTHEEVGTLFREQLRETIMDGAQPRQIARQAANVINADTRKGDAPVGNDQTYAPEVSEGGAIRDDREDYARISWDTTKFGQGARVTDELVDHAMVDLIARQIEYLGAAVENAVNRVWANSIIEAAANNYDATGDDGVGALNGAVGVVDQEDFMADAFVSHPEFRTELFSDSNLVHVNQSGSETELRQRELERVMGVDHFALSGGTYSGTAETWGYSAAGEVGAVVYDSSHTHLVLYNPNGQDIEVKDYDDPIRDLQGVNARIHADAAVSQQRAAADVIYG